MLEFLKNTFILQGGPVMYPLLFVSLLGFVLFVERLCSCIRADRHRGLFEWH